MSRRRPGLLLLPMLLPACSFDTGGTPGLDPLAPAATSAESAETVASDTQQDSTGPGSAPTGGGSSGSSATSGSGTATSDSTSASVSSSDAASSGPAEGSGSSGGPEPIVLAGGPPLVRYFLDEAGGGMRPSSVHDAAAAPLDLPISYLGVASWTTYERHRGVEFVEAGSDAVVGDTAAGTKIAMLASATEVTIEVVAQLSSVTSQTSRLVHIGQGSERGDLSLGSRDIERVELSWGGNTVAREWPLDWLARGRVVVHLVIDLAQAEPVDRARLFVDGVLVPPDQINGGDIASITVSADAFFGIGNRNAQRAIEGVIYYVAIYPNAMSPQDLDMNAETLALIDDSAG